MKPLTWVSLFLSSAVFIFTHVCFCVPSDTLRPGDILNNDQTLVSAGGVFELGFVSTDGSTSKPYVGIWFKNDLNKKAVWVANRDNPTIVEYPGTLSIRQDGNIVINDARKTPFIVNSGMLATGNNTLARLLDSGNFILEEGNEIIWQSFYYPTDTFLPGMKLGWFYIGPNKHDGFLVSWLSAYVPTSGPFTLGLDTNSTKRFSIWFGKYAFQHIGLRDGRNFRFAFQGPQDIYNFTFVSNKNENYITFETQGKKMSWFEMTPTGGIKEFSLVDDQEIEVVNYYAPCEGEPIVYSDVCLLPKPMKCGNKDNFTAIRGSLPSPTVVNGSIRIGHTQCGIQCSYNCLCIAYALLREDDTGCELYYGNKRNLQPNIGKGSGIIYVRGDALAKSGSQGKRKLLLAIFCGVLSFTVFIAVSVSCYLRGRFDKGLRRESSIGGSKSELLSHFSSKGHGFEYGKRKNDEMTILNFSSIVAATNNFAAANKIGEGGFGPVYKGDLLGHEVAVKRLSSASRQGLKEFKNEIRLISNLQHSNLVRLLGFCTEGEEKILIYEYMANRSLDSFLFDNQSRQTILDWRSRVHIIEGIAQGVLYLHKYSRLKIIHRDLKTSNILLDSCMNPKISDFGMAEIFDEHNKTKTRRVCGTYGYMSPEFALHGYCSTKSDVFSFGVIVLEIISGRKNTCFYEADQALDFLGYAWGMWKDGRCEEFMDPTLADSYLEDELLLCIQVGLLCIQDNARDRPEMSDIVSMLTNERTNLQVPRQPALITHSGALDVTYSGIEGR